MSIPDKDLDEPDYAYCKEHEKPHPCLYCRFERQMDRAEELRERDRYVNEDEMRESNP